MMEATAMFDNTSMSTMFDNSSMLSGCNITDEMFNSSVAFPTSCVDGVDGVDLLNMSSDGNSSVFNASGNGTEYFYDDDYYDDYYNYYYLEIFEFELVTMGTIRPVLIFLTTLTNFIVCGYFLTQKNRGKATNLLFISIAFSDTMTGVTLLPNSFGIYAKDYTELSKEWCLAYMMMRFYVSRVFHTVSVWQTVILSIQRYMCVCHPFISGRVCTFWKTFITICFSYIFAAVLHVYHLVDDKLGTTIRCRWTVEEPCTRTCVYFWFTITLQHLGPCILLSTLTIITLLELNKAQKRVSTMSHKSNSSKTRVRKERIITTTAILIVVCFLIPELPHGIYKVILVIMKHMGNNDFLTPYKNHVIICIYEIALIISFHANFWIYCAMMHDFRRMLVKLVTCGKINLMKSVGRLRSLSQTSSRKSNVSRTSSNASRHRVFSRTTSLHSTTSDIIHQTAVIPLTPTKGYDKINFDDVSKPPTNADDTLCDDVF